MALISASEVSTIAFVNALDPALILPMFISSAQTKYIVPLVTQPILDKVEATPSDYITLIDNYIKPYLAFSVKYMFYNQLLTETDTFPTSDQQRTAAVQEVLSIMEVSRTLLSDYLNAEIFTNPTVVTKKVVGGLLKSGYAIAAYPSSGVSSTGDVTSTLAAASSGIPSDADTFNFISFTSGLLNKITWSNLINLMKSAADRIYASIDHIHNDEIIESDPVISQYIDDRLMKITAYDLTNTGSALWQSVFCSQDGMNILAGVGGTRGGRLYYSEDGGDSWTEVQPAGDMDQLWLDLYIDNSNLDLYATTASGHIYRCTDGVTWTEIKPYTPNNSVFYFIAGSNPNYRLRTLAGALNGRLFLSEDKGDSWNEIQPAGDVDGTWNCGAVSENGQYMMVSNLLLGSGSQVFFSSDFGLSWQDITSIVLFEPSNRIVSIAMSFDGRFMAFTSLYGAFISKDYGATFEQVLSHFYCHDCSITRTYNEFESVAFSSVRALHTMEFKPGKRSFTHHIFEASQPIQIAGSWDHKTFFIACFNDQLLKVEFKEFAVCDSQPASGTFVSSDSKTITVTNGIITSIS